MSCSQCESLEHRYQVALAKIHLTVDRRFSTVSEKLRELYRWQDVRDEAVGELHAHRRAHAIQASRQKAASTAGTFDDVISRIA